MSSRYEITALLVGPTWMAGSEIERGLKGAFKEVHEMALLHPFVRRPFRVANCCGWPRGASDRTLTRLKTLLKFYRGTRTMVIRWFRSFAFRSRPLRVTVPTAVLGKTWNMHTRNIFHSVAAFCILNHMQKELKLYFTIQQRFGYSSKISNLAPFMMT